MDGMSGLVISTGAGSQLCTKIAKEKTHEGDSRFESDGLHVPLDGSLLALCRSSVCSDEYRPISPRRRCKVRLECLSSI